jgi:hypothetical protein
MNDLERGSTRWSFIDYVKTEIEYTESQNLNLNQFELIKIYALNPFTKVFNDSSWRFEVGVKRDCIKCDNSLMVDASLGYGLSQHFDYFVLWQFLNYDQTADVDHQYGLLNLELGGKLAWQRHVISGQMQSYYFKEKIRPELETQYSFYFTQQTSVYINYHYQEKEQELERVRLGLSLSF